MDTVIKFVYLILSMWIVNMLAVVLESGKTGFMHESISYLQRWFSPAVAFFYIVFFILRNPPIVLEKLAITVAVIACVFFFTATIDDFLLFFTSNSASQLIITICRLVVVLLAMFICASAVWGVDLAEISTAMGLVTLGISLSFQTILSDLFAGVTTAISKTIVLYERVEIRLDDGSEINGDVTEVGWRYLYIAQDNGEVMTIPHSRLNTAIIVRRETA